MRRNGGFLGKLRNRQESQSGFYQLNDNLENINRGLQV